MPQDDKQKTKNI